MPLPRHVRFLTLLLAAIQFAAPAFVSVTDGAFARLVVDSSMHVESGGENTCTPPHAADCAVCRFLTGAGAGPAERPTEDPPLEVVVVSDAPARETGVSGCAGVRSRAPPALA